VVIVTVLALAPLYPVPSANGLANAQPFRPGRR
jgi:hypothetical protein